MCMAMSQADMFSKVHMLIEAVQRKFTFYLYVNTFLIKLTKEHYTNKSISSTRLS